VNDCGLLLFDNELYMLFIILYVASLCGQFPEKCAHNTYPPSGR